jgi:hypothetical protein
VQKTGLINKEVGKTLNMSEVAVSRAVGRVSQEIKENAGGVIAEWVFASKE